MRVLEALRAHADEGLRFADVARAATVSQATCHAILTTLTDAGYVSRDEVTKTYSLGSALVPLAAGAARSMRFAQCVRPELDDLAERTGLACSIAEAVGDSITIVAVSEPPGADAPVGVGTNIPLVPPFGAIHVAWSDPSVIDAWIARAPNAFTEARLREVVADHRLTHVAVAPYTPVSERVRAALTELATHEDSAELRSRTLELLSSVDRLDYLARDLDDKETVAVNAITAPVFENSQKVAFVVGVSIAEPDLPAARLRALVTELHTTTRRMTESIGNVGGGNS